MTAPDVSIVIEPANCAIEGCPRKRYCRGWCPVHYRRWARYGDPLLVRPTLRPASERFWMYVNRTDSCWLWTGGRSPDGYAKFWVDGATVRGHRVAYEMLVGPIPDGLHLDHLCRVRHCVNPAHLEPVTPRENIRRSPRVQVTHCPQGHPYAGDNLLVTVDRNGYAIRNCMKCRAAASRAWQRRHRAAQKSAVAS